MHTPTLNTNKYGRSEREQIQLKRKETKRNENKLRISECEYQIERAPSKQIRSIKKLYKIQWKFYMTRT